MRKSNYFFGALVLTASFSACSDQFEEITTAKGELQGAELVSKGLKINVTRNDADQTRLNANGWEDGDQAGLVWVTNGGVCNVAGVQSRTDAPSYGATAADNKVAANNLFIYDAASGDFNTVSNIYRGWSFAYYPYAYQETADVIKFNTVNSKVQEDEFDVDRYNAAYVSDRLFLSARDEELQVDGSYKYPHNVNKEEGTLVEGTTLSLKRIVNILKYELGVDPKIAGNKVLKELGVKDLTATVPYPSQFFQTITVNSAALPAVGASSVNYAELYNLDANYSGNETKYAFIGSGSDDKVTTTFKEGLFNLAQKNVARMFVAPVAPTCALTDAEVTYTVSVPGGKFEITSASNDVNKIGVAKLARLMSGKYIKDNDGKVSGDDGWLDPDDAANASKVRSLKYVYNAAGALQAAQTISLVLDPKDFVLDPAPCVKTDKELSQLLTSYEEWAKIGVKPATVVVYLDGNASNQFEISEATIKQANALYTASMASGYPIHFTIKSACSVPGHNPTNILVQSNTTKIEAIKALNSSVKVGMKATWNLNNDKLQSEYTDVINYGTLTATGLTATSGKFATPIENLGTATFSGNNTLKVAYVQNDGTTTVTGGTTDMENATISKGGVTVNSSSEYVTVDGTIRFGKNSTVNNSGKVATKGTGSGKIYNEGKITANAGSETYIYDNAANTASTNVADYAYIYLASRDTKVSVSDDDEQGFLVYNWTAADPDAYVHIVTDRFNSIALSSAATLTSLEADLAGLFVDETCNIEWLDENNTETVDYLYVAGTVSVQKGRFLTVKATGKTKVETVGKTGTINVGGTFDLGKASLLEGADRIYNNGGTIVKH